jgi:NAD(P)-dependent dehydrogenase (short-subunit alcohol dehydrogenase family)
LNLLNKRILITGASSGIGKAIAIEASKNGAMVVLLARDVEKLNATQQELNHPENHHIISCDLTEEGFEKQLELQLMDLGTFDGFVHAAGVSPTVPLKLIKNQEVKKCFQLNVYAALWITQILMKPKLRNSEGFSAVYISSVVSEVGEKGKTLYSMSKSALIGMSKSLALEYASKGVRFNCISPAVVETPLSQKSYFRQDPEAMKEILKKHPLGLGTPEDIGHAAVYLLSKFSKWVTGTNMRVDGGFLAK